MGKGRIARRELRAARKELEELGMPFVGNHADTAKALKLAGTVPEGVSAPEALSNVWYRRQKRTVGGLLPVLSVSHFYQSREWRSLAYKCKLRDGRRCQCCGATPADGVRIVSDHIIPIRLRWDLRLDPTNIQTLCDDCNLGKGSTDQSDFRTCPSS